MKLNNPINISIIIDNSVIISLFNKVNLPVLQSLYNIVYNSKIKVYRHTEINSTTMKYTQSKIEITDRLISYIYLKQYDLQKIERLIK